MALTVDGLKKQFGGIHALQGLSFEVTDGEVLCIIGPNGSGKTTLLNVVSGIYAADGGVVLWNGKRNIAGLSPWQISQAGIARTFQNSRLFSGLTVVENVLLGLHRRLRRSIFSILAGRYGPARQEAWARQRALEVLELVEPGLLRVCDGWVGELAYADQRRVEIARALAMGPSLLLLDEPTAGMNPAECREIVELVLRLRDSGIAVVIVEHNMHVIKGLSSRVIVMDYGEKIAEGRYAEIRRDPRVIECYLGASG